VTSTIATVARAIVAAIFAGVIVWWILEGILFRRLRDDHPEKFREMSEPRVFKNYSPHTTFVLMKFLFCREDINLNDARLTDFTLRMRLFFVVYAAVFVFAIGAVLVLLSGVWAIR
jgi:hypothetical protein